MPRRNGLQRPWHPQQIATWVGFLAFITAFYKSVSPHIAENRTIYWQFAYGFVSFATAASGLLVTALDPMDPTAAKEREAREQSKYYDVSSFPKICNFCIIHTAKSTKHCGHCRKCVAAFDHHCLWVNNCVGGRNYAWFIVLICCLQVQMTGFIGLGGSVIGEMLVSGNVGKQIEASVLLGLLVLGFSVFLLNGVLIIFHIYLRCNGLTTFAYLKHRKGTNAVQPTVQLDSSKLSVHMSHNASLSQEQHSSDMPTFHPDSQQVRQFSACRNPAEELNLRS